MKDLTKIDDYLMGKFSPKQEASFLNEVEHNTELQTELAIAKRLIKGVKAEARLSLKSDLQKIHETINPSIDSPTEEASSTIIRQLENPTNKRRWMPWLAAASVLLVLSLFWFSARPINNQKLFAQNYAPYDLSLAVRGEGPSTKLMKANDLYQQGNFKAAIPIFEEILSENPKQQLIRLGLANSYLENDQLEPAQAEYEIVYQSNDPLLKDQSIWYLALLSIRQDDLSKAKSYLELLTKDPKADRYEEAQQLSKKIK